jgi:beta-aspartyl-peptidase (threonine type)
LRLPATPIIAVHAGAGPGATDPADRERALVGLREALQRGGQVLRDGGEALDAVQAAVAHMEDEVEIFNAGRGAALTDDGRAELSASVMRGRDRDAGAAALITRSRFPVAAARAVLDHSPHVLMSGPAADEFAGAHGVEQCDPSYFVTERQRGRLTERGSDFAKGTVGAVCLDAAGGLAAATSTGGRRGQLPGRVGDTPVIGAGIWADPQIAISSTGDGEAFIRTAAAHQLATRTAAGQPLDAAAAATLQDVRSVGGTGGMIVIDISGAVALPFTSAAMNRGVWRLDSEPQAWV